MTARGLRQLATVALLMLLPGCTACGYSIMKASNSTPPAVRIFAAQPLEPEGWWEDVYKAVETCTGALVPLPRDREYDDIEWLVVPAGAMGDWAGLFSPPRRIFLDANHVMNMYVLSHELMHYRTAVGHDAEDLWQMLEAACLGVDSTP